MKRNLLFPTFMSVLMVCASAGCFGPHKSTSLKEEHERKEQAERRKRHKKGGPKRVDRTNKFGKNEGEEGDGDDMYDGIAAAQQREYDMTHDPTTNTVPKDRLLDALAQRNRMILQQQASLKNGQPILNGITKTIEATSWVERGPYKDRPGPFGNPRDSNASTSGRIAALWADRDPTKPNQVFIGGIDGGLWSCPDITASAPAWTFIDNFSNLAISTICQDPSNPNIMYFGTGEHTVNVDAVRGGGVWKSTDHGATWNLLANTVTFYNVSKILCDKNGYVYVGTSYDYGIGTGVGLQRSTNGGTSWTDITPTISSTSGTLATKQVSDMVYDPINDKMGVYMGYYPNSTAIVTGFCYGRPSTVTPGTWSSPATAAAGSGMFIQANTGTTVLYQTILAVKNGVFWALRSNATTAAFMIYRSLDGGATWTQQSSITNSIYGQGQGWYSIGMDCDPTNPSKNVMIGGLNVFRSTDGGVTFSQVSEWVTGANAGAPSQYVHADVHNIYYNTTAAGLNRVLVCSDGGVFYSNNGGSNWADRNIGLRLKQFYSCAINPSVPDYYLAGAQDNGSHQFTQPGLGASTEVTGGDGAIVVIDQLDPKNQITSYVYSSYHVSTDGGNTWSSNTFGSSSGRFINPFDFDSKTKKMYSAYVQGRYMRWDDPTTTQTTYSAVLISSVIGLNVPTAVTVSTNLDNTIYVAGGSKLAKVVNANTATPTVTDITPPLITSNTTISSIVVGPGATDQDMMVTVSNYGATVGKVYVTADGGTNWKDVTGNLPDMPVRWSMFYPGKNTQAFLATEAGVWYTTSFNATSTVWQPSVGFPAVRCDMIKYSPSNGTIAVATHGRGLWTTKYSTIPKISFYASTLIALKSSGTSVIGCRNYTDYIDTLLVSDVINGTATVNVSIQPGATAKQGIDYDYTTNGSFTSPSKTATFASGVYPIKVPVAIRIYNTHDKNAALPQTATLALSISGATDATISPVNPKLVIDLTDVATTPTGVNPLTLWTENWNKWPATSNSWTFMPEAYYGTPANVNAFIPLGDAGCIGPIAGKTAQLFGTDANGNLALCSNGNAGAYTARFYRAVNAATGHNSNIRVSFRYRSGGDGTTISNALVYSKDNGTNWAVLQAYATVKPITATVVALPATLNNTNFLLGWQSIGTAAATPGTFGFEVDDILLNADVLIDSTVNSTSNNYVLANQDIDLYAGDSTILGNISNPSADLGCVTASIENAGNTWQAFSKGTRSQKTFLITPTSNGSTATYSATLFFTNAELAGKSISALRIAKTSATTMADANSSNTVIVTPTTTNYGTYGVSFTGTFTGFSRFFLVDNSVVLPIALVDFRASLVDGSPQLEWITSMEQNNHRFDVEVSTDGVNFVKLGTVLSQGNSTSNLSYSYTHVKPAAGTYYYRLKQVDNDGRFTYTKTIAMNIGGGNPKIFLYPVPASKTVTVNFGTIIKGATLDLFGNDMKLLRTETVSGGTVTRDVDISPLPAGVYFIRVTTAGQAVVTLRFVKE